MPGRGDGCFLFHSNCFEYHGDYSYLDTGLPGSNCLPRTRGCERLTRRCRQVYSRLPLVLTFEGQTCRPPLYPSLPHRPLPEIHPKCCEIVVHPEQPICATRMLADQIESQRRFVDMGCFHCLDPRKIYLVHCSVLYRADSVKAAMSSRIVVEGCRCYRPGRSWIASTVTEPRTSMHLKFQVSMHARPPRDISLYIHSENIAPFRHRPPHVYVSTSGPVVLYLNVRCGCKYGNRQPKVPVV